MTRSTRHHIVPKFYLKGFSDEKAQVAVHNLETGKTHTSNVSDAALENNYFSLHGSKEENTDSYERFLSNHEGQAAQAILKATKGYWPLPAEDREALATWIAYQHLRVKRRRVSYEETQSQIIRLLVRSSDPKVVRDWIEGNEGGPISDEAFAWELSDLSKSSGPDIGLEPIQHIHLMEEIHPIAKKRVEEGSWTLFYFKKKSLVTSDTPVTLLPGETHQEWSGLGILNAASWVLPISRRLALQISFNTSMPDLAVPGSSSIAKLFNAATVRTARQFLYLHPQDDPFLSQVIQRETEPEIAPIGDGLWCALSSADYSPKSLPQLPGDSATKAFGLRDIPWPIRGRKNSRPAQF